MAIQKITADVIATSAVTTDSLSDSSITAAKLHTTLDLTGKTVTVATASAGDNDTTVASTAFVSTAIANLADSAPSTLDTLNELAAALGDDANFSTTVTNSIALKAPLASPTFTGNAVFDTSTLVVDSTNNRVGIGTTSPNAKLEIKGASSTNYLQFNNSSDTEQFRIDSNFSWAWGTTSPSQAFDMRNNSGNALFAVDRSNGRVGIGTTSPVSPLDVRGGNVYVDGGGTGGASQVILTTSASSGSNFGQISNTGTRWSLGYGSAIGTVGTEVLTWNSSSNVGIGVTSPTEKLEVVGSIVCSNFTDEEGIFFRSGFSNSNKYNVSIMAKDHNGNAADGLSINGYDGISFCTGSNSRNEVVRIQGGTSGVGNVGIGTSSPATQFHLVNADDAVARIESSGSEATDDARLEIKTTNGTFTIQNDRSLGTSGALTFAGNTSDNIVIDHNSGNVGIGTSSPAEKLHVNSGTGNVPALFQSSDSLALITFKDNNTSTDVGVGAAGNDQVFYAGSERVRIDSSGKVLVGNTSSGGTGLVQASIGFDAQDGSNTTSIAIRNYSSAANSGSIIVDPDNVGASSVMYFGIDGITPSKMRLDSAGRLNIDQVDTRFGTGALNITGEVGASYHAIQFRHNASTVVGSVVTTASSTAYNTSSDYRLKENVNYTWDATTRLKQLKPARFNWIADETNTLVDGFLAHEVSSIVPEAVEGEKDGEIDENGNGYQGIDQSKLIPLLTKALQEQQTIIDDLKSRIETLEG